MSGWIISAVSVSFEPMSEFVKEATAGSGTGAGTTATAGEVNDPSAILTLQQLESIDNVSTQ